MNRPPANPPERLPLDAAMPQGSQLGAELVTKWIMESGDVAIYVPVISMPKAAKIDLSFRNEKDDFVYMKASLEARDGLYKAMRKKSWPVKFHILMAVHGELEEFKNVLVPDKGFIPGYLVGLVDAEKVKKVNDKARISEMRK